MSEPPEKIIKSQPIYDGRIVRFRVDTIELPDGRTTIREIVNTPGAVTIIPLTEDRQVRMVRQYRSAIGEYLLELPAGTLRPGEPPQEAAARELAEETGDRAAHWRYLTSFYTMPGVCNEIIHLFLATELAPGSTNHDLDESIEVVTLPLEQAWEMIQTGQIRDAKTIVGLLMARTLERDAL